MRQQLARDQHIAAFRNEISNISHHVFNTVGCFLPAFGSFLRYISLRSVHVATSSDNTYIVIRHTQRRIYTAATPRVNRIRRAPTHRPAVPSTTPGTCFNANLLRHTMKTPAVHPPQPMRPVDAASPSRRAAVAGRLSAGSRAVGR